MHGETVKLVSYVNLLNNYYFKLMYFCETVLKRTSLLSLQLEI